MVIFPSVPFIPNLQLLASVVKTYNRQILKGHSIVGLLSQLLYILELNLLTNGQVTSGSSISTATVGVSLCFQGGSGAV